jgi:hypothetical protein
MKRIKFCVVLFLSFSFVSCVNKTKPVKTEKNNIFIDTVRQIDSNQLIDTSEFISYWEKFGCALLQKNTAAISPLIDDNFTGYCNSNIHKTGAFNFDFRDICTMDFSKDTVIDKQRFIKEFYKSLNPTYKQLLKQYDIYKDKDVKPARTLEEFHSLYRCKKDAGKFTYGVYSSLAFHDMMDTVSFTFKCFTPAKIQKII